MTPQQLKDYCPNFSIREVLDTGSQLRDIDATTMFNVQKVRSRLGVPIKLTSIIRGGDKGQHPLGKAVDFKVLDEHYASNPNKVVQVMLDCGFRGIGVYSWGFHGDTRLEFKMWKRVKGIYLPLVEWP